MLNVCVTRPGSAWMEGTELSGKNSEGQGLRGLRVSEGVAGGNLRRQQSDLMFLPTSGVSGACFSFKEKEKLVRKCS